MIETKHHTFEKFRDAEYKSEGPISVAATLLMKMYRVTCEYSNPVILELGTGTGQSTTVFLQACEETNGRLVSVDIADLSEISDSQRCQFVQSNSVDVDKVLSEAPYLEDGIDVLYIDSGHSKKHIEKEIMLWYPYMNEGGHIFFDDVDGYPYRIGNRKDNLYAEFGWDAMGEFVKSFYFTNQSELYLEIMYGSTGLAHLYKISPKGTLPKKAVPIIKRRKNIFNILRYNRKNLFSIVRKRLFSKKTGK